MGNFQIGGTVYSHADGKVTMRPRIAGGQQKTFLSAKSFEGDANLEVFLLQGTSHEAVAIGIGVSKPDFKIGLDNWEEMVEYARLCGAGHQSFLHDVSITFTQGERSANITILQAGIEKGWGIKSESGGGPSVEVSGKARKLNMGGVDGMPRPGVSGGGGGFAIGASVSIGGLSLGVGLSL